MPSKRRANVQALPLFNRLLDERWPDASGDILPSESTLRAIEEFGRQYVAEALLDPDSPPLAYCAAQWPTSGPALLGMTFAYNKLHPLNTATGEDCFSCLWAEQGGGDVLTKDQMQGALALYLVAHMGRPTAVD
ncbi:MAG: hypothetical protein C0456_18970 [Hyphomonas sp.]|nr:hypothetical protein [Hyphomonas sp.]